MFSEIKLQRARKIIRTIAASKGISEASIRREMNKAIDAGYHNSDPATKAVWDSIINGPKPSPEEFIACFTGLPGILLIASSRIL